MKVLSNFIWIFAFQFFNRTAPIAYWIENTIFPYSLSSFGLYKGGQREPCCSAWYYDSCRGCYTLRKIARSVPIWTTGIEKERRKISAAPRLIAAIIYYSIPHTGKWSQGTRGESQEHLKAEKQVLTKIPPTHNIQEWSGWSCCFDLRREAKAGVLLIKRSRSFTLLSFLLKSGMMFFFLYFIRLWKTLNLGVSDTYQGVSLCFGQRVLQ